MTLFICGLVVGVLLMSLNEVNKYKHKTKELRKCESKLLDITPELAVSAHNVMRSYCISREKCGSLCPLYSTCMDFMVCWPCEWPELQEKMLFNEDNTHIKDELEDDV